MIAYKAFQKNLSCLGFQYKETEWNYTEKAACRKTGFHCAENPLDCLIYYSNPDLAQYCVVEVAGERQEEGDDSKIACTQLRIVRRLTLLELLIEGVAYMLQYPHRRLSKIIQIEKGSPMGGFTVVRGKHPIGKGRKDTILLLIREDIKGNIVNFSVIIIDGKEYVPNGILLSTQQSLSESMNIDDVDKIILPELHYNHAAMEQYYFRFIRYTSRNFKQVVFLIYENSIEVNLLKMILAKEKLNLFMKNQLLENGELYERFGINPQIFSLLMTTSVNQEGKLQIQWGEQKIS